MTTSQYLYAKCASSASRERVTYLSLPITLLDETRLANMPSSIVNAVYYPSWKVYKGKLPSGIDLSVATHVFYAFVRYVSSVLGPVSSANGRPESTRMALSE